MPKNLPSYFDSSYHTIHDLSTSLTSHTDLSFLHMNIRSLSCHFDELHSLLVNLNISFSVVAVSETWDSFARPLSTNVDIPGCTFFSSKSQSQNGGVGLYVKTCLGPVSRPELDGNSEEYETVLAKIENPKGKNILICCAYRHPSTEIDHFTEHLQRSLSNPLLANKHVFILGDFNINLLNFDFHTPTSDFVSLLLSQHYLLYIIHPTSVPDHSSTIIV